MIASSIGYVGLPSVRASGKHLSSNFWQNEFNHADAQPAET